MNTTNRLFAKRKALCFSGEFLKYLAILFIFLFLLFPVYWMVVTSLKINTESYRMVPTLWPQNVSFEGYLTLLKDGKFFVYYKNNLIISALAAAIICFISVFAGYALSRFHFKWNKILFATFAFSQMMPVISRLISLYTILRKLNLTDTHLGLVLAISATQVPFTVSLMASFFDGIPRDLEEAASARMAMLSGMKASSTGIFTNIDALPDTLPTFLHHLVSAGYETVLVGRMHFIGRDQRHGFTKRVAPDFTNSGWARLPWLAQDFGVHTQTMGYKWCTDVVGAGESPVLCYAAPR